MTAPRKQRKRARGAAVGALVEVDIETLAAGGDGVGRDDDGRVTFVPFTAPGDRLTACVVETKPDYARAAPAAISISSGFRVQAPCAQFVQRCCGGCQWLHLGLSIQSAAKEDIVAHTLRRHLAAGMELWPLVVEVPALRWRRRARLHWFRQRKAGAAVIGFCAPRSRRVVDIAGCVQLDPALTRALAVVSERLPPVLGRQGEIAMLSGHRQQVHIAIRGRCDREVAAQLVGCGGIAGVVLKSDRQRGQWGAAHIELEPGLPGRADWFAQASAEGNRALLEAVDEMSQPRRGQRVLELYAGSGNLTRILARGAAEIVAVDRDKPPWKLPPPLDKAFRWGAVKDVVAGLVAEQRRFDLAVIDPPRTGAAEVLDSVVALAPRRILYVSCEPATLARDMDRLVAAGYRAVAAQPIDLMPQTAHVEVVAQLETHPIAADWAADGAPALGTESGQQPE